MLRKCKMTVYIFLAVFFATMCVVTLFFHAWSTPTPKFTFQNTFLLVIVALIEFLSIILLRFAGRKFSVLTEGKFIFITLSVYIVIQIAYVFLFPLKQSSDSEAVVKFAQQFLEGNFTSLEPGHYLSYYPQNIGITLYFSLLYSFLPKTYITLRLFNIVYSTITAWIVFKLYKETVPTKKKDEYGVLLLAVLFLPAIILDNYTYGDVISCMFCLAAIMHSIKFVRTHKMKHAVYTAIFLMLGNFTRGVTLLFLIAILLFWFIKGIIEKKVSLKRVAVAIILTVAIFNLPLQIFNIVGVSSGTLKAPVGKHSNPTVGWINIGFPYNEKIGYFESSRNAKVFIKLKNDRKKASEFLINDIKKKLKNSGTAKILEGYAKKTFWVWTEGTYQVNFYGFGQSKSINKNYLYETPLVKYAKSGDTAFRAFLTWSLHSLNWLLLFLLLIYLVYSIKRKDYSLEIFMYIIFLYIGFYMIWEIKSRYLFGLYPILIIVAFNSIGQLLEMAKKMYIARYKAYYWSFFGNYKGSL